MKSISFLLLSLTLIFTACRSNTSTPAPTESVLRTLTVDLTFPDGTIFRGFLQILLTGQRFVGTATLSKIVTRIRSNGTKEYGWGIQIPDGAWSALISTNTSPPMIVPVQIFMSFNYNGVAITSPAPVCVWKSKLLMDDFVIHGTESMHPWSRDLVNGAVEEKVRDDIWQTMDWVLADQLNQLVAGASLPRTPVPRCNPYFPLP